MYDNSRLLHTEVDWAESFLAKTTGHWLDNIMQSNIKHSYSLRFYYDCNIQLSSTLCIIVVIQINARTIIVNFI